MQGDSRMSGIPSGQEIDWDTSNLEGSGGLDAAMQSGPAAASRREIVHKDAGGRSQYSPIRIAVKGPDNRLSMSTLVVTPFPLTDEPLGLAKTLREGGVVGPLQEV